MTQRSSDRVEEIGSDNRPYIVLHDGRAAMQAQGSPRSKKNSGSRKYVATSIKTSETPTRPSAVLVADTTSAIAINTIKPQGLKETNS